MGERQSATAGSGPRAVWHALVAYTRLGLQRRAHRERVFEARVALGAAVANHLRRSDASLPHPLGKLLAKRREALLQLRDRHGGDQEQARARLRMADYKLGGWAKGMRYEQAEVSKAQHAVERAEAAARALEQRRADALETIKHGWLPGPRRRVPYGYAHPPVRDVVITPAGAADPGEMDPGEVDTGEWERHDGFDQPRDSDQPRDVHDDRGEHREDRGEHRRQAHDPDEDPQDPEDPEDSRDPRGDVADEFDADEFTDDEFDAEDEVPEDQVREVEVPQGHVPEDEFFEDDEFPEDAEIPDAEIAAASGRTPPPEERRPEHRPEGRRRGERASPRHAGAGPRGRADGGRPGGGGRRAGERGRSGATGHAGAIGRVRAIASSPAAHEAKRYASRLAELAEPPGERRQGIRRFARPVAAAVVLTLALASCTAVAAGAVVVAPLRQAEENLPDLDALEPLHQPERTQVFDRHGNVIANLNSEQDRVIIPITEMPWTIQRAVVAAEDERFWTHHGVDERGILRALATNLTADRQEGGSTITQQYVRNTYPDLKADTLARKVKEAALASQVETRFTKQQILEGYLNRVYFGNGYYGVEAAAQGYFGHGADGLTLDKAALLAGIIRSPNQINPRAAPEESIARRDRVLDRMVLLDLIEPHMAEEAKAAPLKLAEGSERPQDSFFVAFLMDRLIGDPAGDGVSEESSDASGDQRLGATYAERRQMFFEGGLNIYTTYDPEMQAQAEAAIEERVGDAEDATAALVAIDPRTGAIRAMATGRNYDEDQYNPAWQGRRSPGSAFKAFVVAKALEDGIHPDSSWESSGLPEGSEVCGVPWAPQNYEGGGSGPMTVREATARSVNGVFARLMDELCPEAVADMAERLGVSIPEADRHAPAIALGGTSVRVLDMASAYATLAAGGVYREPWVVDRIVKRSDPDGEPILIGRSPGEQRVSTAVAYETSRVLESVLQWGTASGRGLGRPAAGKTGTAQNYSNAWFVGYVPQLSTAVWVGNPRSETQFSLNGDQTISGGGAPANIWHDFMQPTLEGTPEEDWIEPEEGLEYRIWPSPESECPDGDEGDGEDGDEGDDGADGEEDCEEGDGADGEDGEDGGGEGDGEDGDEGDGDGGDEADDGQGGPGDGQGGPGQGEGGGPPEDPGGGPPEAPGAGEPASEEPAPEIPPEEPQDVADVVDEDVAGDG